MAPPLVQLPLPVVPLSVKVVGLVAVMVKVPLAAVLPPTPEMTTWVPLRRPLAVAVVMTTGDVPEPETPATAMVCGVGSFAIAAQMACSVAVDCACVKAREVWVTDWLRSR